MVTLVKLSQSQNAMFPILVTEDGIIILVKPLQLMKAQYPIDVTKDGIVMLVKRLQAKNAAAPIDVTEDGITYVLAFFPTGYAIIVCIVLSNKTASILA
jgi:hypothetical protein